MVRTAAGLLVAVLVLCGCWGEPPPRPPSVPSTRPPSPLRMGRLPGVELVGLCMTQSRAGERLFIPCTKAPRPGFRLRGRVIDAVHEPNDVFVGGPSTIGRSPCPPGTTLVRTLLPSGYVGVLCLDTKPGAGNTRP